MHEIGRVVARRDKEGVSEAESEKFDCAKLLATMLRSKGEDPPLLLLPAEPPGRRALPSGWTR